MKIHLAYILFAVLLLSSCSKYEFGPGISLVSREDRLTESWTYTEVTKNGLDVTFGALSGDRNYAQSSIGFAKDGRFSYEEVFRDSIIDRGDGFWSFVNDDEGLSLQYDDTTRADRVLRITRLERSFLWLEEAIDNNNTMVYQLAPTQ